MLTLFLQPWILRFEWMKSHFIISIEVPNFKEKNLIQIDQLENIGLIVWK